MRTDSGPERGLQDVSDHHRCGPVTLIVGIEHLLSAAQPGPTTPMGVHQDLAADLRSDLVGEMFVTEEVSWIVERDSDASAD